MSNLSRPAFVGDVDARADATAIAADVVAVRTITNAQVADSVSLSTLSGAIGGGGGGGLAIFGDGSDGDIVIDSDSFNLPTLAGVDDWTPDTVYAVGDIRKSTGSTPRIWECITGGLSGAVDPFPDFAPGLGRSGDRKADLPDVVVTGFPYWEQVSVVVGGAVEGPINANDFTIQSGKTLVCQGWPIFVRGTATIAGTLSGAGQNATGATASPADGYANGTSTSLMGKGAAGGDAGASGSQGGGPWGGGAGGNGGDGADGKGGFGGAVDAYIIATGFTWSQARRSLLTLFNMFYLMGDSLNNGGQVIGVGGGGGASDSDTGKSGGAGGQAGSPLAVIAKTISLTGSINCKGGNGADGQAGGGSTGGGGGGSGGCCVLCYNTKTGAGTVNVSGGTGGSGQGAGTDGGDGGPGDYVQLANA